MDVDQDRRSPLRLLGRGLAFVLAGAFVALLVYGVLTQATDPAIDDALADGRAAPAPGFSLETLELGQPGERLEAAWRRAAQDGTVDLRELRGTPVMINIWASWCPPCREEAPLLQRGWEQARERGVLFVGIDMQDVREDARDFIAQFGLTFPHVRDLNDDTARAWGAAGIPETFFLDAGGRVVSHVVGAINPQQMRTGIEAAATGRVVGAVRGGEQRPPR